MFEIALFLIDLHKTRIAHENYRNHPLGYILHSLQQRILVFTMKSILANRSLHKSHVIPALHWSGISGYWLLTFSQ